MILKPMPNYSCQGSLLPIEQVLTAYALARPEAKAKHFWYSLTTCESYFEIQSFRYGSHFRVQMDPGFTPE